MAKVTLSIASFPAFPVVTSTVMVPVEEAPR
jgi:hypothetical protein